jgi:hypothetical protein
MKRDSKHATLRRILVSSVLLLIAGASSAQFPGGQFPGGQRPNPTEQPSFRVTKFGILLRNDVAAELKLSSEQKERISAELDKSMQMPSGGRGGGFPGGGFPGGGAPGGGGGFPGGGGGFPGGGMPSMEEIESMIQKKVQGAEKNAIKVLTADQQARLSELYVQSRGSLMLFSKEFRKNFKFTKEENKTISSTESELKKRLRSIRTALRERSIDAETASKEFSQAENNARVKLDPIIQAGRLEAFLAAAGPVFAFSTQPGSYYSANRN